jgi:nitrogenase molybdenum-cofactor synthesis protein NifE
MIEAMSEDAYSDENCFHLSELAEKRSLPKTACAQYPGMHCSFRAVAGTVTLIKDSYALLLGPAICLYNAKLSMSLRSLTSDPRPNNLLFLEYTQDDVIFGFHNKIKEAILEANRKYHPDLLFVITTCLQEIVGEDLEATIEEVQPEVEARLIVIHTENFTCEDATPGIENLFTSFFELMEPQIMVPKSVNILGLWANRARETELAMLLKSKGIEIRNVIPSYCTPSDLATAPAAELNIVLDQYALPLAKKMKESFGTEYIYCRKPYLPASIEVWYRNMARVLEINLNEEIEALKRESEELMAQASSLLSKKSCALSWNTGRTFDMARLLVDLGIKIEAILVQNILPDDMRDVQDLLLMAADPLVFRGDNSLQTESLLTRLKPDIYVGGQDQQSLAKLGIESRGISTSYSMFGFECCNEVLRLLCQKPAGLEALMYKEKLLSKGVI